MKMEGDISDERCRQYDIRKCLDIATALTLGPDRLAVDVFGASGRSVPVFNDKHFSSDWSLTKRIVDQVAYPGHVESYGIYALEMLHAPGVVERRRGGETGVAAVQGLEGDASVPGQHQRASLVGLIRA